MTQSVFLLGISAIVTVIGVMTIGSAYADNPYGCVVMEKTSDGNYICVFLTSVAMLTDRGYAFEVFGQDDYKPFCIQWGAYSTYFTCFDERSDFNRHNCYLYSDECYYFYKGKRMTDENGCSINTNRNDRCIIFGSEYTLSFPISNRGPIPEIIYNYKYPTPCENTYKISTCKIIHHSQFIKFHGLEDTIQYEITTEYPDHSEWGFGTFETFDDGKHGFEFVSIKKVLHMYDIGKIHAKTP